MTALRRSAAAALFGVGLLAGCTAQSTDTARNTLNLQMRTGHSNVPMHLPQDVWPDTGSNLHGDAAATVPPTAEEAPLRPKYTTSTPLSSSNYQIDRSGAVKRVQGAAKGEKHKEVPPPTYSIEPLH